MVHIDLYRLEASTDLDEIGYDEYRAGQGVILVEWAQKMPDLLKRCLEIRFSASSVSERLLSVVAHGPRAEALLKSWSSSASR